MDMRGKNQEGANNSRWKGEICKEELEDLYEGGKSLSDIGKLYELSTATIFRRFKKYEISTDPKRRITKEGASISRRGYTMIRVSKHPRANYGGYVFEHILVMEEHIGRMLTDYEVVHHKDLNKSNNDIKNLDLMTDTEHKSLHAYLRSRDSNSRFKKCCGKK